MLEYDGPLWCSRPVGIGSQISDIIRHASGYRGAFAVRMVLSQEALVDTIRNLLYVLVERCLDRSSKVWQGWVAQCCDVFPGSDISIVFDDVAYFPAFLERHMGVTV